MCVSGSLTPSNSTSSTTAALGGGGGSGAGSMGGFQNSLQPTMASGGASGATSAGAMGPQMGNNLNGMNNSATGGSTGQAGGMDALSQAYTGIQQYAGLSGLLSQGNYHFSTIFVSFCRCCILVRVPSCAATKHPHLFIHLSIYIALAIL